MVAITSSCAVLQGDGLTPAGQDHQALHQVNVVRLQQELQHAAGDLKVQLPCHHTFVCCRRHAHRAFCNLVLLDWLRQRCMHWGDALHIAVEATSADATCLTIRSAVPWQSAHPGKQHV